MRPTWLQPWYANSTDAHRELPNNDKQQTWRPVTIALFVAFPHWEPSSCARESTHHWRRRLRAVEAKYAMRCYTKMNQHHSGSSL